MTDLLLIEKLKAYVEMYREPPFGREVQGTPELLEEAADYIKLTSWIPVSERLPEGKINPITGDYVEYNVTFYCNGKYDTRHYKFGGGHWWNSGTCMDDYVIAWQPLPEPYKAE